jgi:radical SAM protein with 4Fe4S-binding SPASM domain
MDLTLYKKIIQEIRGRVKEISLFHRGEPLLHPALISMIEIAKKSNLKVVIHSNGTLLTKEISGGLLKSGLDFISFSLDTLSPEEYNNKRTGADFHDTVEKITQFLLLRAGSRIPYTVVQLMSETSDIKKSFKAKVNWETPPDEIRVRTPHNWAGALKDCIGLGATYPPPHAACTFPWYAGVILYDGTFTPCPQDFMGIMKMGDTWVDTISKIWNNEKMLRLRQIMKNLNLEQSSPCESCDRIRRKRFLGVPSEYMVSFIKDRIKIW